VSSDSNGNGTMKRRKGTEGGVGLTFCSLLFASRAAHQEIGEERACAACCSFDSSPCDAALWLMAGGDW
jgi:hypothetical protein